MFDRDYRWVLPLLGILMLLLILVTHWPRAGTWYENEKQVEISSIRVTELATWIIEGRNDFVTVMLQAEVDPGLQNIPGLVFIDPFDDPQRDVEQLPIYKQMLILTPSGSLDPGLALQLVSNEKRRVIQVEGGAAAWKTLITAKDISDIPMTGDEQDALARIRPFFHPELLQSIGTLGEPKEEFVAPVSASPPLLEEEEEEEEEEGC